MVYLSDLGKAYYMQKDFTKAETALRQAVRHDPEGLAHYQLALVYRSLGQKEAANEQFEISRKLKLESLAHAETQMKTMESYPNDCRAAKRVDRSRRRAGVVSSRVRRWDRPIRCSAP